MPPKPDPKDADKKTEIQKTYATFKDLDDAFVKAWSDLEKNAIDVRTLAGGDAKGKAPAPAKGKDGKDEKMEYKYQTYKKDDCFKFIEAVNGGFMREEDKLKIFETHTKLKDKDKKELEQCSRRQIEKETVERLYKASKIKEKRIDKYNKDLEAMLPKEDPEQVLLDFIHNPLFSDVTIVQMRKN